MIDFIDTSKDAILRCVTIISRYTPQSFTKQLIIEIGGLLLIIVRLNKSIVTLIMSSVLIGIHYIFHKITSKKTHHFLHFISIAIILINLISKIDATGNANMERYEDVLPGVRKWNGKAFYDFRIIWWPSLLAALASIAQDGWTLLQVARNQDPGAPGNAGNAQQIIQSVNRNLRLFGCMINYIDRKSRLHQFATTQFPNDGRGLFNYIWEFGHLPMTPLKRAKLIDEWEHMSMANTCGKFSKESMIDWAEKIDIKGVRLAKTNNERRNKFYEGIPESFAAVIAYERMLEPVGNYTYPAVYVAHDPRAGQIHPNAGEPDVMACAKAFRPEWERMIIKGLIKGAPRGSAQAVNNSSSKGESDDDNDQSDNELADETANMARSAITERTVCLECGGLFHAAIVDGKPACPNLIMKNKVDRSTLEQIKYPNGITRPKFNFNRKSNFNNNSSNKKQEDFKKKQAHSLNESSSDEEANFTRKGKKMKKFVPKRKNKQVKIIEPDESSNNESNDEIDEANHEEAGSSMLMNDSDDGSISSAISDEVIMSIKRQIMKELNKGSSSDDNGQGNLAVSFDDVRI